MLLRLILSLVTFAGFRYLIYTDQPDLVQLRAQIYAVILENMGSNKVAAAPEQTNLQKLHARVEAERNPCTEVVCPGDEGTIMARIKSNIEASDETRKNFNPKFISAHPEN